MGMSLAGLPGTALFSALSANNTSARIKYISSTLLRACHSELPYDGVTLQQANTLRPLDPRKLHALSDDADCDHARAAKLFLNNDRNLSEGVLRLLNPYGDFLPVMHHDSQNGSHDRAGPEQWHITFQVYLYLRS